MAGLTYTVTNTKSVGNETEVRGTIAFDSSYPTGGEAFTKASIGLVNLFDITFTPSGGYIPVYDYAANKVLVYWDDPTAVAAGPLPQVASTTDLSALTAVRFTAKGN